jgi:hypothetical protein
VKNLPNHFHFLLKSTRPYSNCNLLSRITKKTYFRFLFAISIVALLVHAAVTTVATSVAASSAAGKQVTEGGGNAASGGSPSDPREPLKEKIPHRVRRFHSAGRSKHRSMCGGADNSITQYALIDDDNLSQQVTRGGGGDHS